MNGRQGTRRRCIRCDRAFDVLNERLAHLYSVCANCRCATTRW